ncbi:MAG: 9-O-acetylesterase [Planctomycetes bacterium]|nr:9-O-acetylesterase [Planctomycetota bacterium]
MLPVRSRVLAFLVLVAAAHAQAKAFRLAGIFGDHMVLPAGHANVFGFGPPGAAVTLTQPGGGDAKATIGADGRFRCQVATGKGPGPCELKARCGDAEVVLRDVLIGEVWLGSGQSNMEMPVGDIGWWKTGVLNWQQETAAATFPQIRLFTVANAIAAAPAADVTGTWSICSPDTVKGFSASAYFFGRELHQRLQVPVGLVASSWGGTVCEAWTSSAGLRTFPEFQGALKELAARANETPQSREERLAAYWQQVASKDVGDDGFEPCTLPHLWSKAGVDFDGIAFYRCEVDIPAAWAGTDLVLELPPIDDMDTVWLGGKKVGGREQGTAWAEPRVYPIPGHNVTAGKTTLKIRVLDTGGEGGINGEGVLLRPAVAWGEGRLLKGFSWRRGAALRDLPAFPSDQMGNPNVASVLWNGMIAPLVPFSFAGAIWYQGESNRGRHEQYAKLFPAMIQDWRRAFGTPLPFYFVQIAPFHYGDGALETPLVRNAQAAALSLPQTGMVVTMDIGDPKDIHPRDKQSVGKRLALQALAKTYGKDVACDGPVCTGVVAEGGVLKVQFASKGGPKAGEQVLQGFEIAGDDGVFVPASAIGNGNEVVVRSAKVTAPIQVRYGWHEDAPATLVDAAGLPAVPFVRTANR